MKGWLIINSFLITEKFTDIYDLLVYSAERKGIDLIPVKSSEIRYYPCLPDFAMLWDKDFYLAETLELRGLRLFNNAKSSGICDDKAKTAILLNSKGIPHPKTVIAPKTYPAAGYNDLSFAEKAAEDLGFPLVVKEVNGSFGQQVYLADNMDALRKIISDIDPGSFIMQEFIEESRGTDIRMNVVGNRVVSAIRRVNEKDFRSNITNGGIASPYEPNEQETELALKAAAAAGCDFAGVDILKGKADMVCEINSSPHFKSSELCGGPSIAEAIIDHIIEVMN